MSVFKTPSDPDVQYCRQEENVSLSVLELTPRLTDRPVRLLRPERPARYRALIHLVDSLRLE